MIMLVFDGDFISFGDMARTASGRDGVTGGSVCLPRI